MSIFADDKTLKAPPETIRNNKYNKVEGYKTNIQKPVAFLYTKKKANRKIKKTIPFTISTKMKKKMPGDKFKQGGERPVH